MAKYKAEQIKIIDAITNYQRNKAMLDILDLKLKAVEGDEYKQVEKEKLLTELKVLAVEKAMMILSDEEKKVIDGLFIHKGYRAAAKLSNAFSMSESRIYDIKNKAFEKIKDFFI